MLRYCLFLSFSLLAFQGWSQGNPLKWTLDSCLQYAQQNNIDVLRSKMQLEISRNDLASAQWDYAPDLSFSSSYAFNFGLNIDPVTNQISQTQRQTAGFNFSSSWVLYDGGRKFNTITRLNKEYLATLFDFEQAKNDIGLLIVNAYLNILMDRELLGVAQERRRITQIQVDRMTDRVAAGTNPKGDLLQLKAQLASDRQALVSAENSLRISKIQLANFLQLERPDEFDIADPYLSLPEPTVLTRSPEGTFQVAVERQATIKSAEQRVEVSEEAIDVARAGYLPRVSLIGQAGTNYSDQIPQVVGTEAQIIPIGQVAGTGELVTTLEPRSFPITDGIKPFGQQVGDNLNEFVGVNLQVPIFSRFQVRNNYQNAVLRQEMAQLNLEQAKIDLRNSVYQAHADAKASYNAYLAAEQSVAANKEAFKYASERFDLGALNQLDYENARNNLLSAQSEMLRAKYSYIFKIRVLEFYLTNQIKLDGYE